MYKIRAISIPGYSGFIWKILDISDAEQEGISLRLEVAPFHLRKESLVKAAEGLLRGEKQPWLAPGRNGWTFDLDGMKQFFNNLESVTWLTGFLSLQPKLESANTISFHISPDSPTNAFPKEILVRTDEERKAERALRHIASLARKELCVVDRYIDERALGFIEGAFHGNSLLILTTRNGAKSVAQAYRRYRARCPGLEMRTIAPAKIHARYILLDGNHAYHLGHSLGALGTGKGDASISLLSNPSETIAQFKKRWCEGGPV
jgi:hypothetical protein